MFKYPNQKVKVTDVVIAALPLILGLICIVSLYKKDYAVFPGTPPHAYNDLELKGNSKSNKLEIADKNVEFIYTLGDSSQYPYIGLEFNNLDKSLFDFSGYDYVDITLEAENSRRIPVIVNLKPIEYVNNTAPRTYDHRPVMYEFDYLKGQKDYRLPVKDFKTPSWWYVFQKTTEQDAGKIDFSRTYSLAVQNCQLLAPGQKERVVISSISFGKDNTLSLIIVLSSVLGVYVIGFLIYKIKKKSYIFLPHKELDISNVNDEDTQRLISYITENYSNSELSVEMLQKELGIPEAKISAILRKNFDITFRKYLNKVRMQEAKRLLVSTDRQVMEVAYSVGYGNVSHFNKVFKELEGCSPNEYRKTKDNYQK